jgi:hypothetical protein
LSYQGILPTLQPLAPITSKNQLLSKFTNLKTEAMCSYKILVPNFKIAICYNTQYHNRTLLYTSSRKYLTFGSCL